MEKSPLRNSRRPDYATLAGIVLAIAGVVGGLILEKGKLQDITQFTAFLIVFGGTLGAVLVSTPPSVMKRALARSRTLLVAESSNDAQWIERIVQCAIHARRNGIVSLENKVEEFGHPFLRKGLNLAVDGVDTKEIRAMLELEMRQAEDRAERDAKVFEAAGGYSPTIGIIGAVMGLIQVMKHLENISEVGKGIAVAFVATVYGVGLANLLLLPAAMKIRARMRMEWTTCELMMEGIISIAEGLNPKLIRDKLESFLEHPPAPPNRPVQVAAPAKAARG